MATGYALEMYELNQVLDKSGYIANSSMPSEPIHAKSQLRSPQRGLQGVELNLLKLLLFQFWNGLPSYFDLDFLDGCSWYFLTSLVVVLGTS